MMMPSTSTMSSSIVSALPTVKVFRWIIGMLLLSKSCVFSSSIVTGQQMWKNKLVLRLWTTSIVLPIPWLFCRNSHSWACLGPACCDAINDTHNCVETPCLMQLVSSLITSVLLASILVGGCPTRLSLPVKTRPWCRAVGWLTTVKMGLKIDPSI